MEWLLNVPGNEQDILDSSVTVKADDWFAALQAGLRRVGVTTAPNLSCVPAGDGAVEVRDFVSGRVYFLQPVSPEDTPQANADKIEVFGGRDEVADEGGVSYRERRVCVPANLSIAECEKIARDILEKNIGSAETEQLVVSVQVYDHRFAKWPLRPALVRLAWQQWKPTVVRVDYPAAGAMCESVKGADEESAFFQAGMPATASKSSTSADPFDMKILCNAPEPSMARVTTMDNGVGGKAREKFENVHSTKISTAKKSTSKIETTPGRARAAPKANSHGGQGVNSVDDGVLWAFEQMQKMYVLKEHDAVAEFVRDTLLRAVPSEACAVMLTTPGKSELYVAAQSGLEEPFRKSVRIPMLGGIVGAALKSGVVLNIVDPLDSRFNANVDLSVPFTLKNVLVVPVAFEGHVVGVVELFNRNEEVSFSQKDANVASYVAGAFAEFVQVSLPSREAEFHDGEFEVTANSAGASKKKTAKKSVSVKSANRTGSASAASSATPSKPGPKGKKGPKGSGKGNHATRGISPTKSQKKKRTHKKLQK